MTLCVFPFNSLNHLSDHYFVAWYRARKPKQFDDMLVMNQGHGQAVSDDDDNSHRHKLSTSSATFSR